MDKPKILRDRQQIETVVDVAGMGRLILSVDSWGRYTLHAAPEGEQASADAVVVHRYSVCDD
jgi:hypothetical protein